MKFFKKIFLVVAALLLFVTFGFSQKVNIRIRVDEIFQSVYDANGSNTRPRWRIYPTIKYLDGSTETFSYASFHDNCNCTNKWKTESTEIINIERDKFPEKFYYELEGWEEEGDNDFNPNADDKFLHKESSIEYFFPSTKAEIIQKSFEPFTWKQYQYIHRLESNFGAKVSIYYSLPTPATPKLTYVDNTVCGNGQTLPNDQICNKSSYKLESISAFPNLADSFEWVMFSNKTNPKDPVALPYFIKKTTTGNDVSFDSSAAPFDKELFIRHSIQVRAKYKNNYTSYTEFSPFFYIYPSAPKDIQYKTESVNCYLGNDGKIIIDNVIGGAGPFKFYLQHKDGTIPVGSGVIGNTASFSNLKAGQYTLTVENYASGSGKCSKCFTINIGQPWAPLIFTLDTSKFAKYAISCFDGKDGKIKIKASGGTSPYKYSIDGGSSFHFQNSNVLFSGDTCVFYNLSSGNYQVKVTDKNGCVNQLESVKKITLHQPKKLTLKFKRSEYYIDQHIKCYGGEDGNIAASGFGGTGVYKYSIDKVNYSASGIFDKLKAGNYKITLKDDNDCIASSDVNLVQPQLIQIQEISVVSPKCFNGTDGSIEFKAIGGTSFSRNNGKNIYTYLCVSSEEEWQQKTELASFKNLKEGAYQLKVQDEYQCSSDTIISIKGPEKISLQFTNNPVTCKDDNNGYSYVIGTGGTGGFNFFWKNESTNEEIASVSPAPKVNFVNNLKAGVYSLNIIDGNGCSYPQTNEDINTATIKAPENPLKVGIETKNNITCYGYNDGIITLKGNGGWGDLTFAKERNNYQSKPIFNNLFEGNHTFYVRDNNGCVDSIKTKIEEPAELISKVSSIENVICFNDNDGKIIITSKGGIKPYKFSINGGKISNDSTFAGLSAAKYTINTIDFNGCKVFTNAEISQPKEIKISLVSMTDAACGKATAEAKVTAEGGVSGFSYQWKDLNSTDSTVSNLFAGKYTVYAIDRNNCKDSLEVFINDEDGPKVNIGTILPTTCSYSSDGAASIVARDGHPPYTYQWPAQAGSQKSERAKQLKGGNYIVEVKDAKDCKGAVLVKVPSPKQLVLNIDSLQSPSCEGSCDGVAMVSGGGGSSLYKYQWEGIISNDSNVRTFCQGKYFVTIKDKNNCFYKDSIEFKDPKFKVEIGDSAIICQGQSMTLDAGSIGASFQWESDNGFKSNERQIIINKAGKYFLKVLSDKGCTALDTFKVITSNSLLHANFLVSSKAIAHDTLVLIEISWPTPQYVKWTYPNEFRLLKENGEWQYLLLPEPGKYSIKLSVGLGECNDEIEKEIVILNPLLKDSLSEGGMGFIGIENIALYPNPNSGKFNLLIDLTEELPVEVTINGLYKSESIQVYTAQGQEKYNIEFDIGEMAQGVYYATVKTSSDRKTIKFIIN